jgi:hypothetical protein
MPDVVENPLAQAFDESTMRERPIVAQEILETGFLASRKGTARTQSG